MKLHCISPRAGGFRALAFSVLALATCAHAAVTNVAWYRLGENDPGAAAGSVVTATTTDIASANHLRPFGGPLYTSAVSADAASRIGSSLAVQFNGTSQYLSNALVSTATDNFGLEAWVKPNSTSGASTPIAYNGTGGNGWGLLQSGNRFSAAFGGVTVFDLGPVAIGTWTHLALVRDGGTNKLYFNGAAVGTSTTPPNAPTVGFELGARVQPVFVEFFNGAIDEVRVFHFAAGQFSTNDLLVNVRRVATLPATSIGPTNATLNGSVHPLGFPTSAWFEWGTTTDYGNITPPQALGSGGNATNFSQSLTGLTFGTVFHFRVVASNSLGVAFGANETFRTLGLSVETLPASGLTQTSATLNGAANPGGNSASAWFEWGNTTNYGNVTPPQAVGGGNAPTNFSEALTGLQEGVVHHFRAVASNDFGGVFGADQSFGRFHPQAYLKASNTGSIDLFGASVAIAGDMVVVGAQREQSNATGVNGDQTNNSASDSGAAYVFVRTGDSWSQQAYFKASNTQFGDSFGVAVAVSGDTIVIGARSEDSNATGVNGDDSNNSGTNSGAAYVFVRNGTNWIQQAYLKASNTGPEDNFGSSVAVSRDTIIVGAANEDSNATGANGDGGNDGAINSGAVYVFVRNGTNWSQQAYLKASNTGQGDDFGTSVAIAGDTVVVGARHEDSNATGVNGDQSNNGFSLAGAAYVFVRNGTNWSQQAYLKASNTGVTDVFGDSAAVSGDTIVIGARAEDSNATGVNGDGSNNSRTDSGAAYVFVRNGTNWIQQAYLKASNTGVDDNFGFSVAVEGDIVVVGASLEDSNATGANGDGGNNGAINSGAAYVFVRNGTNWSQPAYLKASNTEASDLFGVSVAVSGGIVVVGAHSEDSNATGINGDQNNNNASQSGAAYVFGPPLPPFAEINVSQSGTDILDGGSQQFAVAGSNTTSQSFFVRNLGNGPLTGLSITIDGPDAALFTVTADTVAPVAPGSFTTFTIRFAPTSNGAKTAVLHIASNDADESPFDILLNGHSLTFTEDRDGDGLNDASESLMAALGFNFQVSQTSLVNLLFNNAPGAGLFSQAQLQALNVDTPRLARDPATGLFTLTIGVEKATLLTNFFPFPMTAPQTTINAEGKLEFRFSAPANAAFFRLEAK